MSRTSLALLATLACATLAVVGGQSRAQSGPEPEAPPNIVVIMTDDQSASTVTERFMPQTHDLLAEPGTVFSNFVITTPICCPSRATFYTGQYAHNNGVFQNDPGYEGLVEKENVLPAWLQAAGYRTALVGKFMHGYEDAVDPASTPAPGYTDWFGMLVNSYYRYVVSDNGVPMRFGRKPQDYATSVINHRTVDLIHEYADGDDPFFIHVAHVAPHSHRTKGSICDNSAQPAPRDVGRYSRAIFPEPPPPSFNEADVLDKPAFIDRLRPLTHGDVREIERRYRCRVASLRQLDRGVKAIVEALEETGELANTVLVLTGDNGYFTGEHRLRRGKGLPYEESILQPLIMRVPSRYLTDDRPVQAVPEVVANIDLAPTLLELAGAEPCTQDGDCRTLDGRSLIPLLEGEAAGFGRRGVLVEYRAPRGSGGRTAEGGACEYAAIRTAEAIYARYTAIENDAGVCVADLEVEHYDLQADPFEIDNLFPPPSAELEEQEDDLRARLAVLVRCNGTRQDGAAGSPDCE
jgi:N-acetylglucosamine-6-sulfatase